MPLEATPRLSLIAITLTYFRQRDSLAISALLNAQPANSFSLTSLTRFLAAETLSEARVNPSEIDSLVNFYGSIAAKLHAELEDTCLSREVVRVNDDVLPNLHWGDVQMKIKGSDLLAEQLACALGDELDKLAGRVTVVSSKLSLEAPNTSHYADVFVPSSLLARAFVILPDFQTRLWRTTEEWLNRGIFTYPMQGPGEILTINTLIYGAGGALREFFGEEKKGRGLLLSVGTVVTVEVSRPAERWGWHDIVLAIKDSDKVRHREFENALPPKVRDAWEGLGRCIGLDGSQELRNMEVADLMKLLL
jgi:hypothetical protein